MPNKEVVFKLGADVTNVKAAVEQISHAMEGVTLPKGLTKDIDAALTQLNRGITDFESKYYIRLTAVDKCGTLGKISTVFGKNRVGITTVLQKDTVGENGTTDIIFVTHDTFESAVRKALKEISSLEGVKSVDAVIRVED